MARDRNVWKNFNIAKLTATQVLQEVGARRFHPFEKFDWYGFAGCEADEPQISHPDEWEAMPVVIILDGTRVVLVDREGQERRFTFQSDVGMGGPVA